MEIERKELEMGVLFLKEGLGVGGGGGNSFENKSASKNSLTPQHKS